MTEIRGCVEEMSIESEVEEKTSNDCTKLWPTSSTLVRLRELVPI